MLMCFSASASFGAGIVLSAISVATIKKAQQPSQIYFASIPLIFCVQQISEGFLWLALSNSTYASLQQVTTYTFLFFAQVLWPIWVPFALLKLEKDEKRKKFQKILVGIGGFVSVYLAYCLVSYTVEAKIIGYHILYIQDYPAISYYGTPLYVIATITPAFISSIKKMWTLGLTILTSYIITKLFYEDYIISVWCFFASIISITIFYLMSKLKDLNVKHGEAPDSCINVLP